MELNTVDDDTQAVIQQLAGTPFDKKWDILKPIIKRLYIDEEFKLPKVMERLRNDFGFHAEETQYKYHVNKKWRFRKNISTPKKETLLKLRQTRAKAGKSTVFRDEQSGKNIEEKRLRRYLKDNMRRDGALTHSRDAGAEAIRILSGSTFQLGRSIFLNWNMPYGTGRSSIGRSPSHCIASPISLSGLTDIVVETPPDNNALSPNNAPSPLSQLQKRRVTIGRAHMFIQGRHSALVKSMRRDEKETISKWLYQFWMYGFKTAKHWGRGPREWTAELLHHSDFAVTSPASIVGTPRPFLDAAAMPSTNDKMIKPSSLCRWSIHSMENMSYESCPDRVQSPEPYADPLDETSWKEWPSTWEAPPLEMRLLANLASNSFSEIIAEDLPIALPQVVKAAERSKEGLLEEALGLAIIARNRDLLYTQLTQLCTSSNEAALEVFRNLKPVHLATTYMDGSRACCDILYELLNTDVDVQLNFRMESVNNLGHTVFDNLMIAILKAHTSITPNAVDDSLRDEERFPGEEVDICGRWDADSDCIRAIMAQGTRAIPLSWKHKFCHTSVQAICHSICILDAYEIEVNDVPLCEINSGLFVKRCGMCGLRMSLTPLHTLVLTAFGLAQFGTKDEDLFGMIAVLLCMLGKCYCGVVAEVSTSSLFPVEGVGDSSTQDCNHEILTAAQLADRVPLSFSEKWTDKVRTGWEIFCYILHRYDKERREIDKEQGDEHDMCRRCERISWLKSNSMRILCSAVETEVLTYRRLEEGDPWMSTHFDMTALLEGLHDDGQVRIDLVEKNMMRLCECGDFKIGSLGAAASTQAEAFTAYHFSNLDDWSRTSWLNGCGPAFADSNW
ncbi:hypothetical protein MMC13_000983 [Lambiella insularis]|nr:hypothetical protein [Lambiella insularis]